MTKAASLTGALLRKPKSAASAVPQAKPAPVARQAGPVPAAPQARPMLATLVPRPVPQRDHDGDIGALLSKANLAAPTAQAKPATAVPPVKPTAAEPPARPTITALPLRPTPPQGNDGITRVSLRINSARHRRLRIAAAHLGLTNSSMMVTAINHYLDHVLPKLMAGESAGPQQGRAPVAANWAALSLGGTQP